MMFRVLASIQTSEGDGIKTKSFGSSTYVGDPMNIVRILNSKGAQEIVLVDIGASTDNRLNFDLIRDISEESTVPFTYAGGINNVSQVCELMALGVEKVAVNSLVYENPAMLRIISGVIGSSSTAFSLDLWHSDQGHWNALSRGGSIESRLRLPEVIELALSLGIGELHIKVKNLDGSDGSTTSEVLDSLFNSYDFSKIRNEVQILVGCGIRTLENIAECRDHFNVDGVILGSQICFSELDNSGILIRYPNEYRIG
jgi:cyclase